MFRIVCVCGFFFIIYINTTAGLKKAQIELYNTSKCDVKEQKYDPEPIVDFNSFIDKKPKATKFTAYVHIKTKTLPLTYNLHWYVITKKAVKLAFNMEKLNCRSPIIKMTLKTMRIKSNEDCSINSGNYTCVGADMSTFKDANILRMPPGLYRLEMEFVSDRGIVLCNSVVLRFYY